MTGIISANDIRDSISKESLPPEVLAKDLANPGIVPVFSHDTLKDALDKMEKMQMDSLPVVHEESPTRLPQCSPKMIFSQFAIYASSKNNESFLGASWTGVRCPKQRR